MPGKTISITIPEQLENELQQEADKQGVSRSRYIGNILIKWSGERTKPINDCINQSRGWCSEFGITCTAPQSEAETCSDYKSSKE